uniref:RNA-directed RNA polymerase n=1 Tax=Cryphonectria nitschkei chrysovirus 1 TaxID=399394 RepID=C7EUC8_9VIRU|nr:RNA-dependent RNA polymerase [Cryphonectria nitschkei chrysovirus 1]ACT79257.1 RNA-dependent RNA polymerase [Cryphonectria nitschkei chrysovirus 1]
MVGLKERQIKSQLAQGFGPRAAARSAVRHDRAQLVPLIREASNAFGSSKSGAEYEARISASMSRYDSRRRSNLFAIVMPAGHGKTHYAKKFGFIDVDELATPAQHNELVSMRQAAVSGITTWSAHNMAWVGILNKTLDLFDYSKPNIIFVHHEEAALEIGAVVLAGLRLTKTAFEMNIRTRAPDDKLFSHASYDSWGKMRFTPNMKDGLTNREVERLIIKILCVNNLPIAAPHMYEVNRSPYYAQSCPPWVLRGESPPDRDVDISELVSLFEGGVIPREAVDYYVKQGYTKTSLDFGLGHGDWAPTLAKVASAIGEPQDFDPDGDLMEVFPPRETREVTRSNVTLRRLDETFAIFEHDDVYSLCTYHVGEPHVFVCSLIAEWKGLMVRLPCARLVARWFCVSYDKWPNILKELHTLVRTSRFLMNTEITEKERQALMYMDLLVGRTSYVINEMNEVDKRGGDTYESEHLSYDPNLQLFTREQYKKDFPRAVRKAYARMRYTKQPRLNVNSFRQFYRRRKEWLTKGSLVYNHLPPESRKTVVQALDSINQSIIDLEARHNKQSLFEEMDLAELLRHVGDASDFNTTKTMIKFETGRKDRTLLPGTLIHFIVLTYVLELAERLSQVGSVRLNAMADEEFLWYDRKIATGLFHVLYDWADFNEQHTASEMSAVIKELDLAVQAPEDYHIFVHAISESMYNMSLHDRDGNRHKIWRGLYSGWRGTTWINSVLNFCYIDVALTSFERIYGYDPVVYIDHGGDDVDAAVDSATSMPKFMAIMDDMMFNANAWKQLFSTRSEFFRNTVTSSRAYASPTRALASFIAGDWEGSGKVTMRERVVNILDQASKMARRGIEHEFANGLAICALTHWCKLRKEDSWVSMPRVIIHGREEDGGLGVPDWDGCVWKLQEQVPDMSGSWLTMLKPSMLSSRDYVDELSKDVERLSLELVRKEQLAEKFAKDGHELGH